MQTYIIHVLPPNNIKDISTEELQAWHSSFLPNTTLDSGHPRLVFSYRHVISGFAARLTASEVKELEKMDGFLSANLDQQRSLQTTYTPSFLNLDSNWQSLWHGTNYGEGMIIGVLDSGVVDTHPSFNDDGMPEPPVKWRGCCMVNSKKCNQWVPTPCNKKLIGSMSFTPTGSMKDKTGHGTHCASIAAGNFVEDANVLGHAKGKASGMAPRAHVASYKVCDTLDVCVETQILAGVDRAIQDGVDVLSMSIYSSFHRQFHDDIIAKATFSAMSKGIIVSACAGNSGPLPNSTDNDAPWIMSVGASSIDRTVAATVKLGNGMEFEAETAYQPEDWDSPMMPIEYPTIIDYSEEKRKCLTGAFNDMNITGKIVLCGIAKGDNIDKGKEVKKHGGKAVIIMNQEWAGDTTYSEAHVLPAAHISHRDALKLLDYFFVSRDTNATATATIIFKGTQFGKRRAPAVAQFSSRGPSLVNGGILKPDIVGPGVNILAAWHEEVDPHPTGITNKLFNFASGCSMATPHLAGVAALLKSSHPDWSPAAIKSAIMTTAHVIDREGKPIYDEGLNLQKDATAYEMGAGHVDPPKANDPGLIYNITEDQYIAYMCGLGLSNFDIIKIAKRLIDCRKIEKISVDNLNYPAISLTGLTSLSVSKHAEKTANRTVTNVGEENSSYSVEVKEPEGFSVTVTPKTLQFSSVGEEKNFTVHVRSKGLRLPINDWNHVFGHLIWRSDKHSVRSPIILTD